MRIERIYSIFMTHKQFEFVLAKEYPYSYEVSISRPKVDTILQFVFEGNQER